MSAERELVTDDAYEAPELTDLGTIEEWTKGEIIGGSFII
jgi:hypothetical protein